MCFLFIAFQSGFIQIFQKNKLFRPDNPVRDFQAKLIDIAIGGGTLNCDIWLSLMRNPLYSHFGKNLQFFSGKNFYFKKLGWSILSPELY